MRRVMLMCLTFGMGFGGVYLAGRNQGRAEVIRLVEEAAEASRAACPAPHAVAERPVPPPPAPPANVDEVARAAATIRAFRPSGDDRVTSSIRQLETLVHAKSPEAVPLAARLLQDADPHLRAAAPRVLIAMDEQPAIALLLPSLRDADDRVRRSARSTLKYLVGADCGDDPAAWTPPSVNGCRARNATAARDKRLPW